MTKAKSSDILSDSKGCSLMWNKEGYPIAWERLDTKEKLLGWVHHLAEKSWMDTTKLKYFIEFVHAHFGWKIDWA